ncbi:MAG TPA: DUF4230 domain-containing protein [Verrucomicrobiae bacterium]|nr:DUF4230 domain-containing protein [Verrucomicrobiae bacterium]
MKYLKQLSFLTVLVLVIVTVSVVVPKALPQKASRQTDTVSVLESVRNISELATVEYNFYQDKTLKENKNWFQRKTIILFVKGSVKAGVNLSKVEPDDISVSGRNILVKVPKAEILSVEIDLDKSKVAFEDTGLLANTSAQETKDLFAQAKEQIREAALEEKILDKAQDGTRNVLVNLLRGLGFEKVEVEVK